jgi:hypothetical protein
VLMGKNTMFRRQVHSPRSMQARCRTLRSAIANMQ